jgi:hypothetical protein
MARRITDFCRFRFFVGKYRIAIISNYKNCDFLANVNRRDRSDFTDEAALFQRYRIVGDRILFLIAENF